MKRFLSLTLVALMLISALPVLAEAVYQPGLYTATQPGFGGDVTVTIETDETSILSVEIAGDGETEQIGGRAVAQMSGMLMDAQGKVDGLSGATVTSGAILAAFDAALLQAKGEDVQAAAMVPGTYTSSNKGFGGYVVTTVEVSEDAIVSIDGEHPVREPQHRRG